MNGVPVLVLANKQDLINAMSADDIAGAWVSCKATPAIRLIHVAMKLCSSCFMHS